MLAWLVILFCPRLKKIGPSMRNCLSRALACACFVVLVVIVKHAETAGAVCGTKSIGRAFEAAGWEVVSLDIVSKFEPTILCDIWSWDYTLFPPGHFDMHGVQPSSDDALSTTQGGRSISTRSVIENPATGLLKTRPFMERRPWWVDVIYCKYGTPYRKQTRLWTNMRWRPRRGLCRSGSRCDAWEDGRHLRGAQERPRLMGGQRERVRGQSRELLYSIPTALCEEIARAATS